MSTAVSFNDIRRLQRKPADGQIVDLSPTVNAGLDALRCALSATSEDLSTEAKQFRTTLLDGIALVHTDQGVGSDKLLKVVSLLSTAFSRVPKDGPHVIEVFGSDALLAVAEHWLVPWVLDCSLRFVHRPLLSLLKQQYAPHPALAPVVKSYLQAAVKEIADRAVTALGTTATSTSSFMDWANLLDIITVSAGTVFPEIMSELFPTTISVAAGLVRASVMAALASADQGPEIQQTASAFALEEVRFCIRVAASHVHKEFLSVNPMVDNGSADVFVGSVKDLLFYGVQMLCSPAFPKDALNAAGLLVATIPTLTMATTTNISLLTQIINTSATEARPFSVIDTAKEAACGVFVSEMLSKTLPTTSSISTIFSGMSPSGKFALFKGLLSNHSASLHSTPMGSLSIFAPNPSNVSGVLSVIVPVALNHTGEHTDPDVRFMAIQTLDSVLRYLDFALTLPEASAVLASQLKDGSSVKTTLHGVLTQVVQIQLALWDDPTQPVSGSLYGTYDVALNVERLLAAGNDSEALKKAAKEALAVQSDRRGKYHMLLTLMRRLSYEDFGAALTGSRYGDTIEAAYSTFATALTNMASNPKVGSVAGDLYTKLATKLEEAHDTKSAQWIAFTVQPVAQAFLSASVVKVANVSDELARSNIAAHIVTPLLKKFQRDFLEPCLRAVLDASPSLSRSQTIVELTYRARSVGLDILDKEDPVAVSCRGALVEALSCYESIRLTALQLLCISTRGAEFVTADQCKFMRTYILANVHNGGDSSVRNALINVHTRWCKRLVDSLLTNKQRETEAKKGRKQQEQTSKKAEDEQALVDEWNTYASMVFEYIADTISSLSCGVAAGEEASSERRFTSLSLLDNLWGVVEQAACLGKTKASPTRQQDQVRNALTTFCQARYGKDLVTNSTDVVVNLFAMKHVSKSLWEDCLAEGWEMILKSATRNLERFIDVAGFEALLLAATGSTLEASVNNALSVVRTSSVNRNCQRAIVHLSLIFTHAEVASLAPLFPMMKINWIVTFTDRAVLLNALCASLANDIELFCKEHRESKNAVQAIRVKPLHGRIGLCGALFTRASRHKGVSTPALNALAIAVLRACEASALLCTELVSGGGDQQDGSVDCRGHVIGTEGQDEAVTRCVVNNSWLGVRASMSVAETVVGTVGANAFPEDLLRLWNNCLAATLLRTKHNGVMSKTRMTLKSFTREMIKAKSSIPVETLRSLIGSEGVSSEDESRILRRSQGLPHAILPVLEAEDPILPRALLPLALDSLVAIASRRNDIDAITKLGITPSLASAHAVNALNVIKYIFDNTAFAAQITPWSQDVFLLAAGGFEDPSWAARNSSMMLFSSVLFRIIGDHPSKGGGGVTTTLDDLYRRIPRGVAFAVQCLEATIAESINTYAVAPALFPLLLMFSMLCPEVATSKEEEEQRLVQLMMQCRCTRNVMARSAGSSAFAALVPPANVPTFIAAFFKDINGAVASEDTSLLNTVHGSIMFARRVYAMYVGTVRSDTKVRLGNHASETTAVRVHDDLVKEILNLPVDGRSAALFSNFTTVGELCGMIADCIAFENDAAVCGKLLKVALSSFLSLCRINPTSTFHQGDRGSCIQAVASCIVLYKERGGESSLDSATIAAPFAAVCATQGLVGYGMWEEVLMAVLEWNSYYRDALRLKIHGKLTRKPMQSTISTVCQQPLGINTFDFAVRRLKEIVTALNGSEKDVSAVLRKATTKTTLDFLSDNSPAVLGSLCPVLAVSDVLALLNIATLTEMASTEVRAAALNLSTSIIFDVEMGAVFVADGAVREGLNAALTSCSHPSQMVKCRVAAVRTVREMLNHTTTVHDDATRLIALVSAILLVCDDEEPVRKVMCNNLRDFTKTAFPLSQPTCLALVVNEAKHVASKVPTSSTILASLVSQDTSAGDAEEDDGDDAPDEALFDAEGDNMFCEAFLMNAIASHIDATPSIVATANGVTLLGNVLEYATMGSV